MKSRSSTKQMWLVIAFAILATFFLLCIGLKWGRVPEYWRYLPMSIGTIWGAVTIMHSVSENRKKNENIALQNQNGGNQNENHT